MACGPQMVGRVGEARSARSAPPQALGFADGGDCVPGGRPLDPRSAAARDEFGARMWRWAFAAAVGALVVWAVAAVLD